MYAEAIASLWPCQLYESHLATQWMTVDAGYVDDAVTIAGKLDEGRRIELGGKRQVYGDAPAGTQMEVTVYVAGDELGSVLALDGRDRAASRPERFAKCCAVVPRAVLNHAIEDRSHRG